MSYNCPICSKAGLPDFTKKIVVCPQCNSDLKAFLLLHSISDPKKNKITIYTIVGILLLLVSIFVFSIKLNSDKNELFKINELLNDSITKIKTSNIQLIDKDEKRSDVEKQDVTIRYVVKNGDYLYKIAQFFYGEGNKYKLIETDNNLQQPYTLKAGQILTIKISQ